MTRLNNFQSPALFCRDYPEFLPHSHCFSRFIYFFAGDFTTAFITIKIIEFIQRAAIFKTQIGAFTDCQRNP